MSATIALLLLPVPPRLPLPRATVRARACGVHDPNFFWLCVLPVVFLLIIQSEARCLQVSQGRERGWEGWGGTALLEGWCMLRFQFGAAGHLFGPLPALLWRPQRDRNRFTGANLARNETDSAASSEWDEWDAAATCAPQPAAFGGNKFVFNLKTFHSSLAFCSLIYGAKRFLFKYHRNFPGASEISARVPPFGCWLDCSGSPTALCVPRIPYLPPLYSRMQTTCKLMKNDFYTYIVWTTLSKGRTKESHISRSPSRSFIRDPFAPYALIAKCDLQCLLILIDVH